MRRKVKVPSVLVVEGDARRLARDRIDVVGPLRAALDLVRPVLKSSMKFAHVPVKEERQLAGALAPYFDAGHRPEVIVLAGHANKTGMRLFERRALLEPPTQWRKVGEWLSPLQPRRLLLVGCEAGSWLPCRTLFESIGSLEVIFGSPLKMTAQQAASELLGPALLFNLPNNVLKTIQTLNFWNTNGVMLCRTRAEFEADPTDQVMSMLVDEFIKAVAKSRTPPRRPSPHLAQPKVNQRKPLRGMPKVTRARAR